MKAQTNKPQLKLARPRRVRKDKIGIPLTTGQLVAHEKWFKDCPDDEARKRKAESLRHCMWLFDELRSLIERNYNELGKVHRSDYSTNPNWLVEQAHRNGQLEALETVWTILPHITNDREPGRD